MRIILAITLATSIVLQSPVQSQVLAPGTRPDGGKLIYTQKHRQGKQVFQLCVYRLPNGNQSACAIIDFPDFGVYADLEAMYSAFFAHVEKSTALVAKGASAKHNLSEKDTQKLLFACELHLREIKSVLKQLFATFEKEQDFRSEYAQQVFSRAVVLINCQIDSESTVYSKVLRTLISKNSAPD